MDLIERYLGSVRVLLPKSQRDDIIAELRDVLTGCREEEATKLGRSLTPEEEESLLREFGHPILVAGRYRPQQYLIGPDLYPVYTFVLKLVLLIVAGAALTVGIVGTIASSGGAGPAARIGITIAWNGAFSAIGGITLIFAILQRYSSQLRFLSDWRARDLPALNGASKRATDFFNHIAGIVANVIFILWWIHVIQIPSSLPLQSDQALHLALAPVWHVLNVPVLGVALCAIAVHAIRLTRMGRGRFGVGLDLLLQLAMIGVCAAALAAGQWVVVTGTGLPVEAVSKVSHGVNLVLHLSLIVVVCVAVIRGLYDLWQFFRGDRTVSAPST
jgi:hypothetical protein